MMFIKSDKTYYILYLQIKSQDQTRSDGVCCGQTILLPACDWFEVTFFFTDLWLRM